MSEIFLLTFVFLAAGAIAVPIASRLGFGSVLGYLLAGILLSPLLDALGVDVISIQHFAEFGVVLMLFLIGLELEPRLLWNMRRRLLGLGGLQVVGTTAIITGVAIALGQRWQVALAIGMILALSSTAIVLQTLNERGALKSDGGEASFSVLLFQDIAVIPMLALLPLLAVPGLHETAAGGDAGHGEGFGLMEGLAGWQQALITVGAIGLVIVLGSYLVRPTFRYIALANLRELFTAVALALVVGTALLMTVVGLSPALGSFLAGVVLANSEYRHELESNIDPFKGLLLGVFFITVGAAINFSLLIAEFATIIALTVGLMAIKAAVLYVLAVIFGVRNQHRWLFSLGLAQAGEFGFVLLSFAVGSGILGAELSERLLLVVTISMLLTPVLFILYDRLIRPRYVDAGGREPDAIDERGTVIIAGCGRFGGLINRILIGAGYKTVVLDYHAEHLERLRAFGIKVFFGDATRPDLLHAAGIEEARMLVVAIDDRDKVTNLVRWAVENHPQVYIVARAVDRSHVYELWAAGARDIIRDTFDSSIRAGRSALEALGVHPYEAELQVRQLVRDDKAAIRELAELYDPDVPAHENPAYVKRTREILAKQEEALRGGPTMFGDRNDRAWERPTQADVDTVTAESKAAAE
ncbi:MAG: monovalent cation:proton antiporter-2 (CPA2) family protein [Woeseiaceae bacterium]|nr:monovalent cation:proton antiporter-2 (CPA2) family protein [Woeseiaceae bacterium]